MHDYKHLKSKDSFFSEHPLFEWNLSNYIKYYEKKYSQKSKKALESTFLYHLKSIARDPSISEELKDAVDDIVKESENKDKVQVESSNCIKINGNVTSSNINLVASSSNIAVERQTIEKAIEERQITEKVIEERQKLRDEVGDLFNPLPTGNAANKRKIDQTEILYDSVNRPIILASQVRHEIYFLGAKRLHGSLSQIEISTLKKMAKNLKPTTMAEELDLMSAQLILDLNDGDINEVNALKLSLSKTVSFVNFSTLKVFQKYIKNESFWEEVNSVNIELAPAMSVTSEETFNRIIQLSKDAKDRLALKQLRLAIAKEKVKAIEENEDDITAVLDIMEITARNIIADDTLKPNENDSEMTCYRKVASILDILLKDLNLNLLDGETTCKASKSIAKDHENIYGNNIPLNRGFGRRIDLLLSTRNIELSTNEWKRKKVTQEQCLIQQIKNIRMNKAILSKLLELPLSENDSKNVYTLGMDWVGPRGYMFAVKKINNIYIAKHTSNLSIPEYLHQLPSFIATLKNLYIWKNHHTKLQDTILTGVIAKEDNDFFFSIASGIDDAGSASKELSPNVYLTPTKAKKSN